MCFPSIEISLIFSLNGVDDLLPHTPAETAPPRKCLAVCLAYMLDVQQMSFELIREVIIRKLSFMLSQKDMI